MNNRGQILLIAALITVGAIFSVTAVINQARANEENKAFYDLSGEINFESKRVLDYGTYKGEDITDLMSNFLNNYSTYIKQDQVIFIFGNTTNLTGMRFETEGVGSVGIDLGNANKIKIQYLTEKMADVKYNNDKKIVEVIIEGITYSFDLESGENFFFVIKKENKGDQLVAAK